MNGHLDARVRITVRETANIEGDMTAPKVSVADGAKFQGKVQTGERGGK